MQRRVLRCIAEGGVEQLPDLPEDVGSSAWIWLDVHVEPADIDDLGEVVSQLALDPLAVRDAVADTDLPKVDDFGHHLLVVLHGLSADRVETYELDCFVSDRHLVTIRQTPSPALEALWTLLQRRPELTDGGADELLARLADVLSRRFLAVVEAFESRLDELTMRALDADAQVVADVTAVRTDIAAVRRVIHPQREVFDVLRHSTSPLVTDGGRRRFADVFDVTSRAAQGLDAAHGELTETLSTYQGAEARATGEATRVLTIYAAVMLPLSLIAGYFGMNFENLPLTGRDSGWILATVLMVAVAVVSVGVFISLGWMGRPSGRRAGATLGRGLVEAARTPVQVVGAVYEISTMPLKTTTRRMRGSRSETAEQ